MKDLQGNLAALAERRAASKKRKSGILETIMEISRERSASAPINNLAGAPAVARRLSAVGGHDDHDHSGAASASGGVNPQFKSALDRLLKDSGGRISIGNDYRSPARQAVLWQNALKKYGSAAAARKWVAPPGKSNHGRGLAADLKFADADAIKFAHQNAEKYGLVFPLSNENWHIEPISARKR